jgi:energy-coupling factor transporter ATP-binding protein EcfA2
MYIRQLRVTNYRSLKDVRIGDLTPFVILYGENDSGKSNILSFVEQVFAQKYEVDVTELPGDEEESVRRPSGFWRGEIANFSDNFFQNSSEPITFSILIRYNRSDIRAMSSLSQEFLDELPPRRKFDSLKIEGQIEQLSSADRARIVLLRAEFNQKLFFDSELPDEHRFLPDFNLESGQSLDVFDKIMGELNGAFLRIPSNRFLTTEQELPRDSEAHLRPGSFKNWLFQNSIDRNAEELFRRIAEQFTSNPFEHGRISIARMDDNEIEVLVEDSHGLKLPIGRKGTGVQQILIILAYIARSSSPLVGIEELEINLSPKSQAAIFNSLFELVHHTQASPINQVFLTTHSPQIAKRDEAERRGVWMENGETKAKKPSEAEVTNFFSRIIF